MKDLNDFIKELRIMESSILQRRDELEAVYNIEKAEIEEQLSKVQISINALEGKDGSNHRNNTPLTPERKKIQERVLEEIIKNGYSSDYTKRKKVLYVLSGEDDMVVHNIYNTIVELDDKFRKALATAPNEEARQKLKDKLKGEISWVCSDMDKHGLITAKKVGNKKAYSLLPDSPRRTKKS